MRKYLMEKLYSKIKALLLIYRQLYIRDIYISTIFLYHQNGACQCPGMCQVLIGFQSHSLWWGNVVTLGNLKSLVTTELGRLSWTSQAASDHECGVISPRLNMQLKPVTWFHFADNSREHHRPGWSKRTYKLNASVCWGWGTNTEG